MEKLKDMIKKEYNQAESKIVSSLRNICEGDKRCLYTKPTQGSDETGVFGQCTDKKAPCCKTILDVDTDFEIDDTSKIPQIRLKLKQFNIREHVDIEEIEKLQFFNCPEKKPKLNVIQSIVNLRIINVFLIMKLIKIIKR